MTSEALKHIAIIMDGNSRWAKQQGMLVASGHKAGVERIRDVLRASLERGVEVLTLFAFSSENWRRPPTEVNALMTLFLGYLRREARQLSEENVAIRIIGSRDRFSKRIQQAMAEAEEITCNGQRTLVIAADYGGKWDMTQAAKKVAEQVASGQITPESINEDLIASHLSLADLPPLDLLIRTGGEVRISNFLLWQAAYTEFYFTNVYWPDFNDVELNKAVDEFYNRQRRFGGRHSDDNNKTGIASA